jgi:uncharacterized Zn-finger protein
MNGLHHSMPAELHAEEKFLAELCAAAAVPAKPVFLERNVVTVVVNNVAMAAHHPAVSHQNNVGLALTHHVVNTPAAAASPAPTATKSVATKSSAAPSSEKSFPCDFCAKSFARRDKLARHRNIHTGEGGFIHENLRSIF